MSHPAQSQPASRTLHPHTSLVHGPDPYVGNPVRASTPPIYLSSTFSSTNALAFGEYNYSRSANPTRDALEAKLAVLEGPRCVRSLACASGVAALNMLLTVLAPGDCVLCSQDVYGGTFRLFSDAWVQRGIEVRYVDATNLANVKNAWTANTKMVHIEPIGNPLMTVCDVAAIAELCHQRGALLSVDNTSLSSLYCKPLELGAYIAMQSATKYICGHGDVTSGVVSLRDEALAKRFAFHHNAEGVALPPFDCYLLHRGMESMAARMRWQEHTTIEIAKRLHALTGAKALLTRVRYAGLDGGLASEAQAALHRSQSAGAGAVICIETGSMERSKRIVESLRLFSIRVSFGSVTSSASLPCAMSHRSIPNALDHLRPPEDLIRLSFGLEDIEDLWHDLYQAIAGSADGPQNAPVA
jgi:cystathionine beta-lyase